ACEVDELPLDLLFPREHALLDLQDGLATVGELRVDLRAELHRLLAGFAPRLRSAAAGFAAPCRRPWRRRPAPRATQARLPLRSRWPLRWRSARAEAPRSSCRIRHRACQCAARSLALFAARVRARPLATRASPPPASVVWSWTSWSSWVSKGQRFSEKRNMQANVG